MEKIRARLFELQDKNYRRFQSSLIPNIDSKKIIGVRIPVLKKFAKEIFGTTCAASFLKNLPHKYYDENNLHAYLIEQICDFKKCVAEVDAFLPFIDNWATCDTLRPKIFKKHKAELLPQIEKWILLGKKTCGYETRFAIEMLMIHFLDLEFENRFLEMVSKIKQENYYTKMMQAWFFATALSKKWEATFSFLQEKKLDAQVLKKTIQKAQESRTISDEKKAALREMKK